MSRKLALLIGNSSYEDTNLSRLVMPDADVNALATVLRDPEIGAFDEVITLINQPAMVIRRAISSFFLERKREDLLLLYFSGHGIRDDRGQLFLAAKDTEHTLLRGTAISAAHITDEMDSSRSRRQVLILDCCHSGAFSRGMKASTGGSVGTATAFEGTGSGRVVLTASDSTQFAWEGDELIGGAENSVFTHFLIQGLQTGDADADADGKITLDELYDYVYEQVVNETPRQTPGKWSYGQRGDIVIARSPRPVTKAVELPADLRESIDDPRPWVREGAVHELERLSGTNQPVLAQAAREALERLAQDDSRRVALAASKALGVFPEVQQASDDTIDAIPLQVAVAKDDPQANDAYFLERGTTAEEERPHRDTANDEQGISYERKKTTGEISKKILSLFSQKNVWLGLILLGGLGIGLWASNQVSRGGKVDSTATLPAAAALVHTATLPVAGISVTNTVATKQSPMPTGEPLLTTTEPVPVSTSTATPPTEDQSLLAKTGGRIAFTSERDGNWDVYLMNVDGTGLVQLTTNPANDYEPSWSPDGKRIAFTSDREGNIQVYGMNADGSEQNWLSAFRYTDLTTWNSTSPAWSPDGTSIAYTFFFRKNKPEIMVSNLVEGYQVQIGNNTWDDIDPAWSPDGKLIAFTSNRSGNPDIYIYNYSKNGSEVNRLTGPLMYDGSAAWSPDGTRIAYTSTRGGKNPIDIYVMNADGSGVTQLTKDSGNNFSPTWSPDGSQIAFASNRDGDPEIYLMNADGSNQTRLTNSPGYDMDPAWEPFSK